MGKLWGPACTLDRLAGRHRGPGGLALMSNISRAHMRLKCASGAHGLESMLYTSRRKVIEVLYGSCVEGELRCVGITSCDSYVL